MAAKKGTTGSALAHTPGTAFALTPSATGDVQRLGGNATASPFQWPPGALPPVASTETNVLTTRIGADTYIETDCDTLGDCDGSGGNEAHLMIYSPNKCTTDPWYNVVTGRCRNDTGP